LLIDLLIGLQKVPAINKDTRFVLQNNSDTWKQKTKSSQCERNLCKRENRPAEPEKPLMKARRLSHSPTYSLC